MTTDVAISVFSYINAVKKDDRVRPKEIVTEIGRTVTFHCISTKNVTWTFYGEPLPNNTKTGVMTEDNVHWMHIIHVQWYNIGTYTCTGEEEDNLIFEDEGELRILG